MIKFNVFELNDIPYLTVANNWNGLYVNVINGELPPCLAVVTEINGQSTIDMSEESYYRILSSGQDITMKYMLKEKGQNKQKECTFQIKKDYYLPVSLEASGFTPNNVNITLAGECDLFKYNTYDFVVTGNDKLVNKEVCEALSSVLEQRGMKRDKQTPDLVMIVSEQSSQSSNSVYVPKTSQVVNTGSNTSYYKDKKGKLHANTTQNYTTVSSGGYTHTDNNTAINVIIRLADGVKYRENSEDPELVWKMEYNGFFNSIVRLMDVVRNDVSHWFLSYPFDNYVFSHSVKTRGVAFRSLEDMRSGKIIDVLPNTDAWNSGLRAGCKIEKVKFGGAYMILWWIFPRTKFKADSYKKKFTNWWIPCYFVPIPIPFPYTTTNHVYDYLSERCIGLASAIAGKTLQYTVIDENGSKFKVKKKKGFEVSQYKYTYINF